MNTINPDIVFYVNLLSIPEVRANINTEQKAQELIDQMEQYIDHGEMPECYNWLVTHRDSLRK